MDRNKIREDIYEELAKMPREDAKIFEAFLLGYRNGIQAASNPHDPRKEESAS